MWLPFVSEYTIKCKDGSVKILYKKVEDAFPLHIQDKETSYSSKLSIPESVEANIEGTHLSNLKALIFHIDDLNGDIMLKFRGAYVNYKSDPCNGQARYDDQTTGIIENHQRLRTGQVQIQALLAMINASGSVTQECIDKFLEIVDKMGNDIPPLIAADAAAARIEQSREIAKDITGDKE